MTMDSPSRSSLVRESAVFAGRLLTLWRRDPAMLVQAVVFPTFLLITYKLLVGKSILKLTGTDSLYSLVPMCAVAGAMFGALATAPSIRFDRHWGLLTRFWALPVHRASALTGRLCAEAARTFLASALLTAVGVVLGLRFNGGIVAVVPFLLVPVAVGVVFSSAVIAIATRYASPAWLIWLGVPAIGSVFSSSGVPPIDRLPAWMRPFSHLNPAAPTVDAMRRLALGELALWPFLIAAAWTLALAIVFVPLAITGYRTAATSGR